MRQTNYGAMAIQLRWVLTQSGSIPGQRGTLASQEARAVAPVA